MHGCSSVGTLCLVHLRAASGQISAVACALPLARYDLVHSVAEELVVVLEASIELFVLLELAFGLAEVQLAQLAVAQLLRRTAEVTARALVAACVELLLQLLLGFLRQRPKQRETVLQLFAGVRLLLVGKPLRLMVRSLAESGRFARVSCPDGSPLLLFCRLQSVVRKQRRVTRSEVSRHIAWRATAGPA